MKKLIVVLFMSMFLVACGMGNNDETPNNNNTPNDTPMDERQEQNDGGLPGDTDENLNREQIDEDILPNEEDILPDDNNNN